MKKGARVGGGGCTEKKWVRKGREKKEKRRTYTPPHFIAAPGDFVAADEHAHGVAEVGDAEDGVVLVVCVGGIRDGLVDGAFCVVLFWCLGRLGYRAWVIEDGEEGCG